MHKVSSWLSGKRTHLPMLETQEMRVQLLVQGRSPGVGNGNPLQYFCLENSMDRGAWWPGYSPWGRNELDTTEHMCIPHSHKEISHINVKVVF